MNNSILNKRQDHILSALSAERGVGMAMILAKLAKSYGSVTKITVVRDLDKLIGFGYVARGGKGRATVYRLSPRYELLRPIDIRKYFEKEADERIGQKGFNFGIFPLLQNLFAENDTKELNNLNEAYRRHIAKLPKDIVKSEFERLTVEFSWKSSRIEGNTYSLLETETLLKEGKEAKGHKKDEAIMILNHKKTLDFIHENPKEFKKLSLRGIEHVHGLLIKGLGVSAGLRKSPVGITGTAYRPLDNIHQIRENMEKACDAVNKVKDIFEKCLIASLMIAYIQPFADGNKRTSRMIGNAILIAHGFCPLSYRSANETEYKKAVILFYERNNLHYFKTLFMEQFRFAVENYFKGV